jgi:hypothetical protein
MTEFFIEEHRQNFEALVLDVLRCFLNQHLRNDVVHVVHNLLKRKSPVFLDMKIELTTFINFMIKFSIGEISKKNVFESKKKNPRKSTNVFEPGLSFTRK